MVASETLEKIAQEHEADPNYEVEWDTLSNLFKTGDPLQDKITKIIDKRSMDDRELIRSAIGYKNCFCPDYKKSRGSWLDTAERIKGDKLTPDEVLPIANRHRIYFALTHPRGMNISAHTSNQEKIVYELICEVINNIGPENCKILGYKFGIESRAA